ncbi:MAG: nascent polypeptide-associated complex protein [Thermoplasmata archaeon]|nr:MAG: nascent polypeptide-associated complex protein [Thermoplasmata archaeon]
MFPKLNPRQMKKLMQQMGMKMTEIKAKEVIIRTEEEEIIIESPNIVVVEAMNQKTYQITGKERVKSKIPEEDIKLVAQQANVSEEEAKKALEEANGDLAKAIMILQEK